MKRWKYYSRNNLEEKIKYQLDILLFKKWFEVEYSWDKKEVKKHFKMWLKDCEGEP